MFAKIKGYWAGLTVKQKIIVILIIIIIFFIIKAQVEKYIREKQEKERIQNATYTLTEEIQASGQDVNYLESNYQLWADSVVKAGNSGNPFEKISVLESIFGGKIKNTAQLLNFIKVFGKRIYNGWLGDYSYDFTNFMKYAYGKGYMDMLNGYFEKNNINYNLS